LFCGQVLENDGADENLTLIISKKRLGRSKNYAAFPLWSFDVLRPVAAGNLKSANANQGGTKTNRTQPIEVINF